MTLDSGLSRKDPYFESGPRGLWYVPVQTDRPPVTVLASWAAPLVSSDVARRGARANSDHLPPTVLPYKMVRSGKRVRPGGDTDSVFDKVRLCHALMNLCTSTALKHGVVRVPVALASRWCSLVV